MVMVISELAIIFSDSQTIKYKNDVVIVIEVCAGGGAARGLRPVPLGESSCLHRARDETAARLA